MATTLLYIKFRRRIGDFYDFDQINCIVAKIFITTMTQSLYDAQIVWLT
tara:strand:+ start:132912 stop:133058 length:147 start_codon:yes stop_codon:yes gene_type:complete